MKKGIIAIAACAAASLFALSGCEQQTHGGVTTLATPASAEYVVEYDVKDNEGYKAVKSGAQAFSAKFSAAAYNSQKPQNNFAVSPVSVYMALSLAAECAGGDTREELLGAIGVSHAQLQEGFPYFYRTLSDEEKRGAKLVSKLELTNSIWIDNKTQIEEDGVNTLAEKYFCYSYHADFLNGNKSANDQIRKFVKKHTNGLIDRDFGMSPNTLIALINTLYLKDIWNYDGDKLFYTPQKYTFTEGDGNTKDIDLLSGYYIPGRAQSTASYESFYTATNHNYKIKFIKPKDGYTLKDVFTEETLAAVNSISDYGAIDTVNKKKYNTRCLFPEYTASCDINAADLIKDSFGVQKLFTDLCDFSNVAKDSVYCEKIQHVSKLEVNKKGIEGAAATALLMGATSADPNEEYEEIFEDFILDKAFGFILTDRNDCVLFSGVVNKV